MREANVMFNKFRLMKYPIVILLYLFLTGCASLQNDVGKNFLGVGSNKYDRYMVAIADIEWVKLYPNQIKEDIFENEITISNGCGKAEVQYKTTKGKLITGWMEMGEWCKNPFDYDMDTQLIVVDSKNNRLKEYYPIEKIGGKGDGIYFLELYQFETSIFRDLVKPFDEPLYLFPESRANEEWIEIMTEEGLIENRNHKISALKGVYISDVINHYHLKKE